MVAATTREKLRARAREQWRDPDRRARILAGQRAARLFRDNLALATWAAQRFAWSGLDFDDLRQCALLGLYRASRKYEPGRGARFSTVAAWYMFSAIHAEIAATRSVVRVPARRPLPSVVSLDAGDELRLGTSLPDAAAPEPEAEAERALLRERVAAVLGTLSDRERFVVEHHYGINGARHPHTLEEIAARLGVSRARAGQIEAKALARLRFRLPSP